MPRDFRRDDLSRGRNMSMSNTKTMIMRNKDIALEVLKPQLLLG
jgi:hypothetical protein